MKIIILCGGAGTRFNSIYPKPLNLVMGVPMIYRVINTMHNITSITIIYNTILNQYGFKEYLINTFPTISFEFLTIDFQTRGAAETLYLGLSKLKIYKNENIVVLDNDNIYEDIDFTNLPNANFIMYNNNLTGLHHYSFVSINDQHKIINIIERKPISDYICVGGYGFSSIDLCMQYCKQIILNTHDEEPYLSKVMKNILEDGFDIEAVYCPKVFSIGTPKDILLNISKISNRKLKVVFDLDNTIVSYPSMYKDYNTVSIIHHIKSFIDYLKQAGHEVIIYTARNMVTSNNNTGKVIKNVGQVTLNSLEKLGISYDEIHFGKPYGDIYIDDKAFNTYDINIMEKLGFYDIDNIFFKDIYKTNRFNTITRINQYQIRKSGKDLSGEIYYYSIITKNKKLIKYFPKFFTNDSDNSITLEYINGTSISKIYHEGLLPLHLFDTLLQTIQEFHNINITDDVIICEEDIKNHYFNKFEERSKLIHHYPFEDFKIVYDKIKENIYEFLNKKFIIHSIIHGDLWFSNMMYYNKQFYFYDMRGKIDNILTIKGHILYDYAKLYQSIIGLDSIINYNSYVDESIKQPIEEKFWDTLYKNQIISSPEDKVILKKLTGYLIYNTFFAYDDDFELSKKNKIWELVKQCIY